MYLESERRNRPPLLCIQTTEPENQSLLFLYRVERRIVTCCV